MRISIALSLLSFTCALAARADVVSPDQEACFGKKAGDACSTCIDGVEGFDQGTCGTCTVPPPSCQAGACRRFGDETSCRAEPGCSWAPGAPICSGAACACKDDKKPADVKPQAKAEAKESSCAAGAPASLSLGAIALAIVAARRRRTSR